MRVPARLLLLFCAVPVAAAQRASSALEQHVEAAQQAQRQQDCHTAASEYKLAAKLLPDSGELRSNLGVALYCDGQITESIAALRSALRLSPTLAAPHLFLGLAAYRLSDPATAVRELEHFLELSPADPIAHLWLGYAYVAQHRYPPAVEQFEKVAQLDPTNVDAQYALGQSYLEIGRAKARELEALSPQSPRISHLAGEQFRLLGDQARASAAFQQEKTRRAASPVPSPNAPREEALYNEALAAETKSQQAFQSVMQQAPDSYRAHQILADAYTLMQQQPSAIAEYQAVIRLNPTLPGVHEALSHCLMQTGQFPAALENLRAEQKLEPQSPRVLTELGRVQLAMGDYAGASASLHQALTHNDPPPEAYLLLGRAALRTGDTGQAVQLLEHYVALDPNSSAAFYLLARAYKTTNDRASMQKALATYSRLAEAERQRQITQAVTQDPNTAPAAMNAGELQEANALLSAPASDAPPPASLTP